MNYDKLKNKYERQYKLSMLVGCTLIVVGGIVIGTQIITSILLGLMGISLLATARRNHVKNLGEIEKIESKDAFNNSMANSLMDMPEFSLYVSDKYVISELKGLKVYVLKDMKKFEVGIAGDKKKSLFLTDKYGMRHEIAGTVKGDKRQKSFDQVYFKIKDIFDNKKYR